MNRVSVCVLAVSLKHSSCCCAYKEMLLLSLITNYNAITLLRCVWMCVCVRVGSLCNAVF